MPEAKAKEEWKKYCKLIKERKGKVEHHLKELKATYYNLSKGFKIIDIYEAFKSQGLTENEEPKIAICRADIKNVIFQKESEGRGLFTDNTGAWGRSKFDVQLPSYTFKEFTLIDGSQWAIKNKSISAPTPVIPAEIMPDGKLENYYILWEVEEWKPVPPKDPILLKRISPNLFAVIATWNLTKIEQAVMKGHIR